MMQRSQSTSSVPTIVRLGLPLALVLLGVVLAAGLAKADARPSTTLVACAIADGPANDCRLTDGAGIMLRRQSGQLWIGPYRTSPVRAGDSFFFPYLRDAVVPDWHRMNDRRVPDISSI